MKKYYHLTLALFSFSFLQAQSDNCTGVVPSLTVGTSCNPTNYNVSNTFVDNFSTEPTCGWDDVDGFYQFTATSTYTSVTVTDNTPAGPNPGVMVLSGTCGGTFTEVGCSENGNGVTETVNFGSTIGTVYYVVIFATNNAGTGPPTSNTLGTVCVTESTYTGPVSASDCADYVNICSNSGFQIDANGYGSINEIPALGSIGNPDLDCFWNPCTAGGNMGCLRAGENNSTWMVINVYTAGTLEFTFGGGGAQTGFYDWIMYPYTGASTCAQIAANNVAPVRCNWNGINSGGTGLASTIPSGGDASNYEPPLNVLANTQYIICFSNYSSSVTTVPLAFGGTATIGCSPLGDNINQFDVTQHCGNKERTISWTSPLFNQSSFEIQRSEDGKYWEILSTITQKDAVKTLDNNQFSFRDYIINQQITYYRIKEIAPDGKTSYSELKSVICKDEINLMSLAPNPSNELTNLTYYSNKEGKLSIIDNSGRIVDEYVLENTHSKIVTKPIQVSTIEKGVYQFYIFNGETTEIIPFIKN